MPPAIYSVTIEHLTEPDYCPYCDHRFPLEQMTDEHIIPQAIGGDKRSIIRVCGECNKTVGAKIDLTLSKNSYLRLASIGPNKAPNRFERHPSQGKLKDGKMLIGHSFISFLTPSDRIIAFEPLKHQPDGSIWLSAEAVSDIASLPDGINIYRPEELDKASFNFAHPEGLGMEPAFIKIFLGFLYFVC